MTPYTIAVAGKGGTGKTTVCGMLIEALCQAGRKPVLAVDADSNANLNEVLGVPAPESLGSIRESIKNAGASETVPATMTKQDYLDTKFMDALSEEKDYDLLVMGRTQGTGCYCFVNSMLKMQIDRLAGNYKYVVVDNEAGMEHISRGILPGADLMLLVSDCSVRGMQAAARIQELIFALGMQPGAIRLIVNKVPPDADTQEIRERAARFGLSLAGLLPEDRLLYEYDARGEPTAKLPSDSAAKRATADVWRGLGLLDETPSVGVQTSA
ncbi:MAG: AAA family ATPase [Gracilibacteraceae bacterium]|jgi:CO dehydrogenase maturation factor|nr:AAA family ATPase [Gracilibacteraceae bacterium]